jgi:hypothetical protein
MVRKTGEITDIKTVAAIEALFNDQLQEEIGVLRKEMARVRRLVGKGHAACIRSKEGRRG